MIAGSVIDKSEHRYQAALAEMHIARLMKRSKATRWALAMRKARRKVRYWEKKAYQAALPIGFASARIVFKAHPDLKDEHVGVMCEIEGDTVRPLGSGVVVGRIVSIPGDGTAIVEIG